MALTGRASLGSNPRTAPQPQAPHSDPYVFPNGVATAGLRTAVLDHALRSPGLVVKLTQSDMELFS